MLVTIFTPSYNRKDFLKRLYESLLVQTCQSFEWIIIDDGSVDETERLVRLLQKENKINIIYQYQENAGKHVAINNGIELSNGEYFAIVDSDDYLLPNAIESIINGFSTIAPYKKNFAGVAFNRGFSENKIIGKTFMGEYVDASSIDRKKHNIYGDKFEVFFTHILKKNKFPVMEGEKFMSEIVLWTRIASQGYLIRWFNDIIYICEYLPGGLTDRSNELISENYKGYSLRIREQVSLAKISIKEKLGYYSAYYRSRMKTVGIRKIANELDTNIIMIFLSVIARKIKGK